MTKSLQAKIKTFKTFNLFESSFCNLGSIAVRLAEKLFLDISVSDLSNRKIEVRRRHMKSLYTLS